MNSYEETAKMLRIIPRLKRALRGSFVPELENEYKKNELLALSKIEYIPHKSMTYYAAILGLECSSFTYIVDKLESKGLISRIPSVDDKRKKVLELMNKGIIVTNQLDKQFEKHITKQISVLDEKDLIQLEQATKILEKIAEKVERK